MILISAALRRLLLGYMKKAGVTTGSVFLSKNKTPLDRSTVWRRMKALCERAGVDPRKVFPHSLRHLFARVFTAWKRIFCGLRTSSATPA